MPTSTVEDYLKQILMEEQRSPGSPVPTGHLAQALRVTPGTATAMMRTLSESGLAAWEPYVGVRLTPAGRQLATHVLRRHRLVELFLVEVMGLDWSEVHPEAEVLEHAVSDRLIERMDAMLGCPAFDPHGDPIPGAEGEPRATGRHQDLLECAVGTVREVARVTDQRPEFLRLLEDHGIRPGRRLRVETRDGMTETVEVAAEGGRPLRLGFRAATRVFVAVPAEEER
jgi:DtxR family Mn-dependent transcriptional regulator